MVNTALKNKYQHRLLNYPDALSTQQACEALDMSDFYIQKLFAKGLLPKITQRQKCIIPKSSVLEYMCSDDYQFFIREYKTEPYKGGVYNKGKVIAIVNQKGGTGKTTICANLGVGLANKGLRVCMIDLDSQGNLTMGFGYEPDEQEHTITGLLNHIITGNTEEINISDYLLSAESANLIPSDVYLEGISLDLSRLSGNSQTILKTFIEAIIDQFDYILLDCTSSLNQLTLNALTAADSVLIPVQPQFYSAKGLELLIGTIFKTKEKLNPNLSVNGIVITMRDGRSDTDSVIDEVDQAYGKHIKRYENIIPYYSRTSKVQEAGITFYSAKVKRTATHYRKFVREFLQQEGL